MKVASPIAIPLVDIPIARPILVTNTTTAHASANFELALQPFPRHLLFRTGSDMPGDLRNAVGVVAKGSGVYAVALLKSGLKMFALAGFNNGVPPAFGIRVNWRSSVDTRC